MKIKLIGQSTFQIKINNLVILTDPWFGLQFLRATPLKTKPEEITKCDLMLVTHNHLDHFDNIAIELAKKLNSIIVGPNSVIKRASKKGAKTILLNYKDEKEVLGLKIKAMFAQHTFSADAVSFFVEGENNFYFSGDTIYSEKLVDELKNLSIDVAFLQIACATYFFKKDGLDLRDAVKLTKEIKPKIAVPMHYQIRGKLQSPEKFKELAQNKNTKVIIASANKEKELSYPSSSL